MRWLLAFCLVFCVNLIPGRPAAAGFVACGPIFDQAAPADALLPHNVILMIADGWGANQIAAANAYAGDTPTYQTWPRRWMTTYPAGSNYDPASAWVNFSYVTGGVTDSAAAATALYTGVKTANGRMSVSASGATRLFTIADKVRSLGRAAGAVSSVLISHATPGAWGAHNDSRNNGYAIADESLWGDPNTTGTAPAAYYGGGHGRTRPPLDVLIGAGHPDWYGGNYVNSAIRDKLAAESGQPGAFTFVERIAGSPDGGARLLAAANTPTTTRLAGLFGGAGGNLEYRLADGSGQNAENPTLAEITTAALTVLDRDPDGFVLMVEGGAIDWAGHANNLNLSIGEMIDFDAAVQVVADWVADPTNGSSWADTLVIVTGDHETGYLTAGPGVFPDQPLGAVNATTVALEKKVTSTGRRASWADADADNEIDAGETVYWAWNSGSHTNSLIPLYARGAGADLFAGYAAGVDPVRGAYLDNTDVHKVMDAVTVAQTPDPTAHGYPRLANYYLNADDVAAKAGLLKDWDLLVLDAELTHEPATLGSLKTGNPDILLYAYQAAEEISPQVYAWDGTVRQAIWQGAAMRWLLTQPGTALSGAASAAATSLVVANAARIATSITPHDDAGGCPAGAAPGYALVGDEIVRVTGKAGNALTVARGQFGTTAAAHNAGDRIANLVVFWAECDGIAPDPDYLTFVFDVTDFAAPDANGDRWNTYLPQALKTHVWDTIGCGAAAAGRCWDGLYFDNSWQDIVWLNEASGGIDANLNDIADQTEAGSGYAVDLAWRRGMATMLQAARAGLGPSALIMGNMDPGAPYADWANGMLNEEFPSPWMGKFDGALAGHLTWSRDARSPHASVLNGVGSGPADYRLARFTAGAALLTDAYISVDAGAATHYETWWFDEYNRANANHSLDKHYLGDPLGPAQQVTAAPILAEDFEAASLPAAFFAESGARTTAPGEVVSDAGSWLGDNTIAHDDWFDLLCTDPAAFPLTNGQRYTVQFEAKVLENPAPGYHAFYAEARNASPPYADGATETYWYDATGRTVTRRFSFRAGIGSQICWGMGYQTYGRVSIDSIRVYVGQGGLWRRNYELGAVLVNPTDTAITYALGAPYRKLSGGQDPAHNDGVQVTSITVPAQDAYVLLAVPPASVTYLSVILVGADLELRWTHADPTVDHYQVWGAVNAAYFSPDHPNAALIGTVAPGAVGGTLVYTPTVNTLGDLTQNGSYLVRAVNAGGHGSASWNRVGEFDFGLVAGE